MKFLFWRILVCDLLSNNTDSTNCRLLYTRILWNVPKSSLFLQNTKVVVYNSLISIFQYLQRLSKYSIKPYFNYFWLFSSLRSMKSEYFDSLIVRFLIPISNVPLFSEIPIRKYQLLLNNRSLLIFLCSNHTSIPPHHLYARFFLSSYLQILIILRVNSSHLNLGYEWCKSVWSFILRMFIRQYNPEILINNLSCLSKIVKMPTFEIYSGSYCSRGTVRDSNEGRKWNIFTNSKPKKQQQWSFPFRILGTSFLVRG